MRTLSFLDEVDRMELVTDILVEVVSAFVDFFQGSVMLQLNRNMHPDFICKIDQYDNGKRR